MLSAFCLAIVILVNFLSSLNIFTNFLSSFNYIALLLVFGAIIAITSSFNWHFLHNYVGRGLLLKSLGLLFLALSEINLFFVFFGFAFLIFGLTYFYVGLGVLPFKKTNLAFILVLFFIIFVAKLNFFNLIMSLLLFLLTMFLVFVLLFKLLAFRKSFIFLCLGYLSLFIYEFSLYFGHSNMFFHVVFLAFSLLSFTFLGDKVVKSKSVNFSVLLSLESII